MVRPKADITVWGGWLRDLLRRVDGRIRACLSGRTDGGWVARRFLSTDIALDGFPVFRCHPTETYLVNDSCGRAATTLTLDQGWDSPK
jgi:hypothetical protein